MGGAASELAVVKGFEKGMSVSGYFTILVGGRDYDPEFGCGMTESGMHSELLQKRFDAACKRLGLTMLPLGRNLLERSLAEGQQLSLL